MQLYLFGKFCFVDPANRQSLNRLSNAPKIQELLAYLWVHARQPLRREEIARDVWHEHPAREAYEYACRGLKKVQALFGEATPGFLSYQHEVQANSRTNLWVDVQEFESIIEQASRECEKLGELALFPKLLAAAELYRGPFLEGCYSPWCSEVRNRLEQNFIQLLETLMDAFEQVRDYDTGIRCGLRAIAVDRARESAHRRLMRLLYVAGDRTAALRQYRRCAEALAEELDSQPGAKTAELYRQIQSGGQLPVAPAEPLPASLHKTLVDLRSLDQAIGRLQEIQLKTMTGVRPASRVT